jgi:serine/threonine protein kinase
MGAVYRGHDPSLDRTVALKVVLDQNPNYLARFQREAKAVARLSHPNIVQVHDFGQDHDGNPFLVMELVRGKSLDVVIKDRGPMAPDKVVDVLRQAALGLQAAHSAGIVHRDIKPQNMLLDEAGQVKLVDFGIARVSGVHEGLTSGNEALGTLHYMAPEVLSGQQADHRADIYSLGLVAFNLLSGKPPFSGPSAVAGAMKQINDPLPDLHKEAPGTPAVLQRLIERMTLKDRERRPRSCDEVAREAAAIADELSRTAPMTTTLPPGSRRIVLVAGGLGLSCALAVALIVGGLGLKRRRGETPIRPVNTPTVASTAPPDKSQPVEEAKQPVAATKKPPLSGPVRVAILRFRNLTGDAARDAYGEGVAEAVTLTFDGMSDKIRLLERNQLETANLPILKESLADFTDKDNVVKYGNIVGAEVIVQGAFQRLDNQLRITARFTRVETSEILATQVLTEELPSGKSGKAQFALFDKVAAKLREQLLEVLPRVRG